jgi:2-polyprenyl-3-methyl-5-hydroxy-6-metoxy-1,4-benzoquinol methylase
MINPGFPKKFESLDYILDAEISDKVSKENSEFNTEEVRFDDVYTYEIWKKLSLFNIKPENLDKLEVLDICAGSGFLSYHLLKKSTPKKITLLDISQNEIDHAKNILNKKFSQKNIEYSTADFLKSEHKKQFDLIIGNSFLHHFYNVPEALLQIKSMLNPGGTFIALHEPTVTSLALESRNPIAFFRYIFSGDKYIEYYRKKYSVSPYPGVSTDVWMFTINDLNRLLNKTGFKEIKCIQCNLFRSITAAYLSFIPGCKSIKTILLKTSIKLDYMVSSFLPKNLFSSVVIFAKN